MGFLGRLIWRTSVRKGFFGGQRTWMTLFAVVGAVKAFRRFAGGTPDVVYTEELAPGRSLVITHHADLRLGDRQR
ncbi:MAG TPA: hypothetical protein VM933_03270 [Acidimicrobiales bacterium]|nr:hypothetical protein [Acidimicrobiales bacterium]